MAIFDSLLGYVPLPTNQNKNPKEVETVNVVTVEKRGTGDLVDAELPNSSSLRSSSKSSSNNSIIDKLFTTLGDVSNFIHLPVPKIVKDVYKDLNNLENIISDPKHEGKRLLSKTLFSLFDPDGPSINHMVRPTDLNQYSVKEHLGKLNNVRPKDLNEYKTVSNIIEYEQLNRTKSRSDQSNSTESVDYTDEGDPIIFEFQGRKSVKDLTMRLNHLWDIKVEPYFHREVNKAVEYYKNDPTSEFSKVLLSGFKSNDVISKVSKSPYYSSQLLVKEEATLPDTEYMPIMSYELNMKTLTSKEVELFSGSSISVPEVIRYTSHFSMQVLDDRNKRWRRWFQAYSEAIYNEETSVVTPYKNSCLLVNLYQYRSDRKIISQSKLLCVLKNYQMSSQGTGSGNAEILDLEFSIVGMLELPKNQSHLRVI